MITATLALALTAAWFLATDQPVGPVGYVSRAAAFLILGGLLGRFVDQRRRLERMLGRHHELTRDLVATAGPDGYFKRINESWSSTLGYTADELLSQPFVAFVHPDDRERTISETSQLTAGRESINFRNRYRAADGRYRWLDWAARFDADDGLIYASARDVTEQKLAEEALERHRNELEELVQERTAALDEARLETLGRLALAAEYRDDDTHQHTERVGHAAALLACELGLPAEEVDLIRQAAPLHDIGKIGISDTILLKPGRLTSQERATMQEHVRIGAAILAHSKSLVLQRAEEIALTHHERWDGTGYPAGLRADAIPISGRIVGLIDVFDALTHARPYKQAFALDQALREIEGLAGSHFDPAVVEAFMRLPHRDLVRGTPLLHALSA